MPSLRRYRIVIGERASFNEKRAASILATAVRVVLGCVLETVSDKSDPEPYEIVIGRTNRAKADSLEFISDVNRKFDFVIRYVGTRLYIVGLGADAYFNAPYKTYAIMNDGAVGTVLGVYRFCTDALGYDHALAMHDPIFVLEDVEIDSRLDVEYTREAFMTAMPPLVDGTVMYSIPSPLLDTAQGCTIFKTETGKLVVIDGGVTGETDHFLRCLEHLSGAEKPRVSVWLHSHLHADHFGVLNKILLDDEYRDRVDIDDMYVGFPPLDYFLEWSPECHPSYEDSYNRIMSIDKLKGTRVHRVSEGEHIVVDELDFKVVRVPDIQGPAPEGKRLMNINDTSVIYKLFTHGQSILFLGDAEQVCNSELLEKYRDELPCDILQVPHHGNGNVSIECYNVMKAKLYLFQACYRSWFSEGGEGLFSRNIGIIRTHHFIKSQGVSNDKLLLDGLGIVTLELPAKL